MPRKIKLVWDFYGGDSKGTAEHHVRHLKEFMQRESLAFTDTSVESTIDMHHMATMTVNESDLIVIRDVLKPNRAFIVE